MTVLEYLNQWCDELTTKEFYRSIFSEGELENKGEYVDGKYTAIAVSISAGEKNVKRHTILNDLEGLDELCDSNDFCIMAPISYAGKSRKSSNARFLYALAIDVDGIKSNEEDIVPEGLETLLWQFDEGGGPDYIPKPTHIVFSGSGLHLYYVFEKPIPLFKNIVKQLEVYKRRLTWMLWTQGVTNLSDAVQYESLFQGFRIPGTITKNGGRAKAFAFGEKITMEYLNQFVPEQYRVSDIKYKSYLTREMAKQLYPDWYERRVVKKEKKGSWICNRAVYDWWLRRIKEEAEEGHRYWCIMVLAVYAKKCDISIDELKQDALSLVSLMDERGHRENNKFTEDDVLAAINAYDENYITYPIHAISERTGIEIKRNKRNGRTQKKHLMGARAIRDINNENWREGNGRPLNNNLSREELIESIKKRKDMKITDIARELGVSRNTIYKYKKIIETVELD